MNRLRDRLSSAAKSKINPKETGFAGRKSSVFVFIQKILYYTSIYKDPVNKEIC